MGTSPADPTGWSALDLVGTPLGPLPLDGQPHFVGLRPISGGPTKTAVIRDGQVEITISDPQVAEAWRRAFATAHAQLLLSQETQPNPEVP